MEKTLKQIADEKGLTLRTDEHNESECFGVSEQSNCYWLWTDAERTHYVIADLAQED